MPWRIVSYNVFSGSGRGPEIFGTEPWDFYIRNLLLNFNVWFLLALAAGPLISLQNLLGGHSATKQSLLRLIVFVSPFYMWLAIFSLQSHKEERFMYPAYPFLGLNAAIALHIMLSYIGSSDRKKLVGRIHSKIKLAFVSLCVILAVDVGVLRILGIVSAYRAPLEIYIPLRASELGRSEETVCFGKEWYRFPSSHFLPKNMRAKFVHSDFDGLLPGSFNEAKIGFGFFPGTWLVPPGMNDQNIGDPGKYVRIFTDFRKSLNTANYTQIHIDHCSFLVDSHFPSSNASVLEPNYILDTESWEELYCGAFLDTSRTSPLGRILWVPEWSFIPVRYRRKWGRHCLMRRRSQK